MTSLLTDGDTGIQNSAFSELGLTSLIIPESAAFIDKGAFCKNEMTSMLVHTSITTVEGNTF